MWRVWWWFERLQRKQSAVSAFVERVSSAISAKGFVREKAGLERYSVLRLVLPHLDRERAPYDLKEAKLARLIADALQVFFILVSFLKGRRVRTASISFTVYSDVRLLKADNINSKITRVFFFFERERKLAWCSLFPCLGCKH